MFQVKRKDNNKIIRNVFDTKEYSSGTLMFLTFDFGKWFWILADDYVPIDFD